MYQSVTTLILLKYMPLCYLWLSSWIFIKSRNLKTGRRVRRLFWKLNREQLLFLKWHYTCTPSKSWWANGGLLSRRISLSYRRWIEVVGWNWSSTWNDVDWVELNNKRFYYKYLFYKILIHKIQIKLSLKLLAVYRY